MTETEKKYREARKGAGIRPETAASKLGVSITTLLNWERGDTVPNADSIANMAKLYGVTTDYLLGLPV